VRQAEYAFRKNRKTTFVKKTNEEERSATKLNAFPIPRKTVAEFLARVRPNENTATFSFLCELSELLFKFRISENQ